MNRPDGSGPEPIIPTRWTPQQAVAVFELLDALRDRVWDLYGTQIQHCLKEDRASEQPRNHDHDADPPF